MDMRFSLIVLSVAIVAFVAIFLFGNWLSGGLLGKRDKSKKISAKEITRWKQEEQLGFVWAKFYIYVGFILGGLAFLIGLVMLCSDRYKYEAYQYLYGGIPVINSLGLYLRKKWGLYVTYVVRGFDIVNIIGVAVLVTTIEGPLLVTFARALGGLTISCLWIAYFLRRRELFR